MKYISVCSGIEAATVAWHPLGWAPVAFSEIEPFCNQVLTHHYPHVPNLGDMTKFNEWNYDGIDLLVGGTPCQSFSVAGLRKGLADPRGNLALVYCGILDRFRPRWFVWENVPGVLSSARGRDFGAFLGALAELGYGFAYRVLDAQYFGVAQRRRRVFVVGHLGDWRPAAAVLFERESLRRDTAPRREAGQGAAVFTPSSIGGYREGFGTLRANGGDIGGGSENLITERLTNGGVTCYGIPGNWIGRKPENGGNAVEPMHDVAPCLTKTDKHGVAYNIASDMVAQAVVQPIAWDEELNPSIDRAGTLVKGGQGGRHDGVMQPDMAVRRLTPTECERLQGFPDGYTKLNNKTPDSARYKALGNSMAVPVMNWIGRRIAITDMIL